MKSQNTPFSVTAREDQFFRNGIPHRIFSGALHYFRIVPEYWEDRLRKCRAMGLNTIETYVAWNIHEPKPSQFDFEGRSDLRRFITCAGDLGLDVIVRPGPYICAEWEFGGLPAWLLADRTMKVRTRHPQFLAAVDRYLRRLMEEIGDLQCSEGGPIIALQVENEYGSYGNSHEYMQWIRDALDRNGAKVLLFTSDGPTDAMLQGGGLEATLKTANFGSHAEEAFAKLRQYETGPLMCMEFWNGWFDHWGQLHHQREAEDAAKTLDKMLELGGSVNLYMAHGGTNFGFMNGANHNETYRSTVTSYDYDAPISEHGTPNQKFHLFRDVFVKHGAAPCPLPEAITVHAYGSIKFNESADLFEVLGGLAPLIRESIPTMEEVGQNYGFIHYRNTISGPRPPEKLYLDGVNDRAWIYLNGEFVAVVGRDDHQAGLTVSIPDEGGQLDILVENLGRVNYGPKLHDRKGIIQEVRLNNQFLSGWQIWPMELSELPQLPWKIHRESKFPAFYRGCLDVDEVGDTFLCVSGNHGIVWINGFCLGRYWKIGPQKNLYVPGPLLKKGSNAVVVFELDAPDPPNAAFVGEPNLGPVHT